MDLSGKFSSASAKGVLFLPLRFQPDECRDEESGLLPSPLVIACANPDASHFCAMVTLSDAGSRMEEDDDAIQAEWTVPEGAVGGQQISDTIEVNGRQIMFVGTIPETSVPGDVITIGIRSGSGRGRGKRKQSELGKLLRQNSGRQQRQLSAAVKALAEDAIELVHALSTVFTGRQCDLEDDPLQEDTEELFENYMGGQGKELLGVTVVNQMEDDLTMVQIMQDGSVGKRWRLAAYGQVPLQTPVGAHFVCETADRERVWKVTIQDEHAADDLIFVEDQRRTAPQLDEAARARVGALIQCLGNIQVHPDSDRYRKLPLSNAAVQRLQGWEGCSEVLTAVGFVEETIEGKPCLHIPAEQLDLARLEGVLESLRAATSSGAQQLCLNVVMPPEAAAAAASPPPSAAGSSWSDFRHRKQAISQQVLRAKGGPQLLEGAGFEIHTAPDGGFALRFASTSLTGALRALEGLKKSQAEMLEGGRAAVRPPATLRLTRQVVTLGAVVRTDVTAAVWGGRGGLWPGSIHQRHVRCQRLGLCAALGERRGLLGAGLRQERQRGRGHVHGRREDQVHAADREGFPRGDQADDPVHLPLVRRAARRDAAAGGDGQDADAGVQLPELRRGGAVHAAVAA